MLAYNALALDLVDELASRVEDAPVPRAQLHLLHRVRRARRPLLHLRLQVEPDATRRGRLLHVNALSLVTACCTQQRA